jgi:TPR repeat protein
LDGTVPHNDDLFAIGKFYAGMNCPEMAMRILKRGLAQKRPGGKAYWRGVKQLSFLHKRGEDIPAAMALWKQAAERGQPYAHVELAKVYEHRQGDFVEAARWTQAAIEIVTAATTPRSERIRWLPELQHRLERLERRIGS